MLRSDMDKGIINIGNLYRFHRVFDRLKNGDEITVVFLGGSITQDCLATKHELCYAFRTFDWFRRKFPAAKINYINAGIGGTTSQFGAARVEEDVLSHSPDIVFVEFSVNDSNDEKYKETYESLLRKILSAQSEPAVFTFNNVRYDNGENAQEVHNEVARYYKLPVVSMKDSIYRELLLGHFSSENITADHLHPNDVGHGLLAEVICNLLDTILSQYYSGNVETEEYTLPEEPLTKIRYMDSARYRNEIVHFPSFRCEGVTIDDREQYEAKDCFKKGIIFNQSEAYICLKLKFKSLSVQYMKTMGKHSPLAALYIDGKKTAILDGNFDENWDCLYLHDICSFEQCEEHDIRIEVENYPENCGQNFYFVSFITTGSQPLHI